MFKQILPGAQPLLAVMQEIAQGRGKTVPQVNSIFLVLSVSRLCCVFQACGGHGVARQPWITARLVHFVFCESSIGQSQVPMYRCKRCAGSHPILTGTGVPVSCLLLSGLHTSPHFVVFTLCHVNIILVANCLCQPILAYTHMFVSKTLRQRNGKGRDVLRRTL